MELQPEVECSKANQDDVTALEDKNRQNSFIIVLL